jgi:Cdc6-like AAA superfamily ATPase
MDFSKLHNPFDFANPVIDPKLFAGRKNELEDIEYYLNHAKSAPRAINLALIGDRASGKTSLLN